MSDLSEFITAMLDAEEAVARAAADYSVDEWCVYEIPWEAICIVAEPGWPDSVNEQNPDTEHIARQDPAATLARVAALRAVVEMHALDRWGQCKACDATFTKGELTTCPTLRALAQAWRGAEGWRKEWQA